MIKEKSNKIYFVYLLLIVVFLSSGFVLGLLGGNYSGNEKTLLIVGILIAALLMLIAYKTNKEIGLSLGHNIIIDLENRISLEKYISTKNSLKEEGVIVFDVNNFSYYKNHLGFDFANEVIKKIKNRVSLLEDNRKFKLYYLEESRFAITLRKEKNNKNDFILPLKNHIENHTYDIYSNVIKKNINVNISITIGYSFEESIDVIDQAELALTNAKYKNTYFLEFKEDDKANLEKKSIFLDKINRAISQEIIKPNFQPIVDKDGNIRKYEALGRIIDPDTEEIIYPDYFLPVLQKIGNYEKFTKIMISEVLKCLDDLNCEVSINLSYQDIVNDEIVQFIEEEFKKHRNKITIELLESENFGSISKVVEFCKKMKSLDVQIAIDDFGSGYSNFSDLVDLEVDIIKIDRSITEKVIEGLEEESIENAIEFLKLNTNKNKDNIKNIENNFNKKNTLKKVDKVLKSIINLSRELNCKIVIEYVEDDEYINKYIKKVCKEQKDIKLFEYLEDKYKLDLYQGYKFGRPMSIESIIEKRGN